MKSIALILAALVGTFLIIGDAAAASGLSGIKTPDARSSLYTPIAARCVRLMRRGNQETLVNSCSACRIVGITRKRSGIPMPVQRSFNVHGGTSFQMPFRGPGRSRITTVQNCQSNQADAQDAAKSKPKKSTNQCVNLKQGTNGKVILVNSCGSCRAAAIQRMDKNGRVLNRQAFKLRANDMKSVKPKGAARVGLLIDVACPS